VHHQSLWRVLHLLHYSSFYLANNDNGQTRKQQLWASTSEFGATDDS
jgi:hypothetical protein